MSQSGKNFQWVGGATPGPRVGHASHAAGKRQLQEDLTKPRVGPGHEQKRARKVLSLGNLGGGQQEAKVPFSWGGQHR